VRILTWLRRRRPVELDEHDFKKEVRAHLAIVLGGVVLATLVPAWRVARTSPLRALRHQ
jgi:ABC-type lipoprotein release transport system permease subunit